MEKPIQPKKATNKKLLKTADEIRCKDRIQPSRGLRELIILARESLPVEQRDNLYAIHRRFDEIVTSRYGADTLPEEEEDDFTMYETQLSRMKIDSTHDTLAQIRHVIFR